VPTYEYACTKCGEHLEVVQSFRDDALTECPNCGGKLRKVFGSIGVVFKGSGFYKTDSRPAAKTASGDAAASSAKSGDGSSAAATSDTGSSTSDTGAAAKEKSAPSADSASGSKSKSPSKSGGSTGSAAAAS